MGRLKTRRGQVEWGGKPTVELEGWSPESEPETVRFKTKAIYRMRSRFQDQKHLEAEFQNRKNLDLKSEAGGSCEAEHQRKL